MHQEFCWVQAPRYPEIYQLSKIVFIRRQRLGD